MKYRDCNEGVDCNGVVLKVFFRSLPDPLFTYAAYQRFMMAMDPESEEEKVRLIFQHISKLPSAHFDTLHATVVHLLKLVKLKLLTQIKFSSKSSPIANLSITGLYCS